MPAALPPQLFRFHDIAAVAIASNASFVRSFFESEYGYHRAEPPAANNLPQVALDFHLEESAPAGYTRHVHKFLARWNYQIAIQPGKINLSVYGNRPAVAMVHHMLVHPSLRWLAANQGTLLLHAGAVARRGKSLIFTGKGGAGKTTTTSLVLASSEDWHIHADDYVFLGQSRSRAYITRSHLYRDLQKWVPQVRDRLTLGERVQLEFFGALRQYSREAIKWPVRLSPQRLWPGKTIAPSASPAAILLLERTDISTPVLKPVQEIDETVSELLEMNFSEARHFLTLLQKAGMLDQAWLADWKAREASLLQAVLRQTPTYRLELPFSQSASTAHSELMPLLDELLI